MFCYITVLLACFMYQNINITKDAHNTNLQCWGMFYITEYKHKKTCSQHCNLQCRGMFCYPRRKHNLNPQFNRKLPQLCPVCSGDTIAVNSNQKKKLKKKS